jgi:predicted nucleotide-binding protein (sugar kinase/HSP70/actin superfamily)
MSLSPTIVAVPRTRIGLPRAFYYYSYPGLWEAFFGGLGMEVVISARSTARTLQEATLISESEHCLPNKLFDGHLASLIDRVDAVFIPRVLSMNKGHIACPKFGALPDAARASIASDVEVISVDINESSEPLSKTLLRLGRHLGFPARRVRQVVEEALSILEARWEQERDDAQAPVDGPRFLLLGHPYTLGDAYIADPVLRKLQSMNVNVERMAFGGEELPPGDILWCTFHKMYRKIASLDPDRYRGIIQISTFNCGCDTMMVEKFRRLAATRQVPYMVLMTDEHSAQAGLDTRLEAFVDSLGWKTKAAVS